MVLQNMDLTNVSSNFTGLAISIFSRSNQRSGVIIFFIFLAKGEEEKKILVSSFHLLLQKNA